MNDSLEKHKYLIALSHFPKFGPARLTKLLKYFKTDIAAFEANSSQLSELNFDNKLISEFLDWRKKISVEKIIEKVHQESIQVITPDEADYPDLLLQIYQPPRLLYYKGVLKKEDPGIAIVGSRKFSHYGERATEIFSRGLALNGLTIISGLALGIDTIAHQGAINEGKRTLAVIGSGLDKEHIYPRQNLPLAENIIAAGGAILTEFPLGTEPLKINFPQRNRIIAGLARATLVIEARLKSGALITSKYALEYNRDVFALPGSIFTETGAGPNQLLTQGAIPALSVEQILDALDLEQINQYSQNRKIIPDSKEEAELIDILSEEPIHIDDIIRASQKPANVINSLLITMEMKGMIKNVGGMNYVLKNF